MDSRKQSVLENYAISIHLNVKLKCHRSTGNKRRVDIYAVN